MGATQRIEGTDVSEERIAEAERCRIAAGIEGRFYVSDANRQALPANTYDLIVSTHSFHHFVELEHVMEQVHEALTPDGLFILEEFVGPTQFQWTDLQMHLVKTRLARIPEHLRMFRWGALKNEEGRPTPEQVVAESPFESIRSSEIFPLFKKYFDVVAIRKLGGTLQHLLYNGITHHFRPDDAEAVQHVNGICALENALVDHNIIPSDFMLLAGRRRDSGKPFRQEDGSKPPPLSARHATADAMIRMAGDPERTDDVASLLAPLLTRYAQDPLRQKYFTLWERHGFHLVPNHFYHPIPDTRKLHDDILNRVSAMPGVAMNEGAQLELLNNAFTAFSAECDAIPHERTEDPHRFHLLNPMFSGLDALVLYCMVRHFKPGLVLEIGTGFSTLLIAQAAVRNASTRLICIDPFPPPMLDGLPGLSELITIPVQEIAPEVFERLDSGDILFIDSSHVVACGSDVNHLILEILPRLKPGVVVHFHDIFLPSEYPRPLLTEHFLFWSEQYLLHAFLAFNEDFEVLFANNHMERAHPNAVRRAFPKSNRWMGDGSFWIRRKLKPQTAAA
jgi:SAM-dependent methyltransferase